MPPPVGTTHLFCAGNPITIDGCSTAATHCLLRWYQQGINVDNEMLALSTYVGHAEVTYTYWYITGIPELMAIAARRFEQFVQGDLT